MQVSTDPRHVQRQEFIQVLFQWDFRHHDVQNQYVKKIIGSLPEIDKAIQNQAKLWKIEDMAKIDVSILRLAVWELMINKTPKKTAIDEAIELAKEFGNEKSPVFISGVLGRIYENGL